jgi:hypothetical protein
MTPVSDWETPVFISDYLFQSAGAPRLFSAVYFSGDIDKVTRRYSRRLNLLSRSEIIIGSEIITGVSQSETGVIRNQTHHSYKV